MTAGGYRGVPSAARTGLRRAVRQFIRRRRVPLRQARPRGWRRHAAGGRRRRRTVRRQHALRHQRECSRSTIACRTGSASAASSRCCSACRCRARGIVDKARKYVRRAILPQPQRFFSYNLLYDIDPRAIFTDAFPRCRVTSTPRSTWPPITTVGSRRRACSTACSTST